MRHKTGDQLHPFCPVLRQIFFFSAYRFDQGVLDGARAGVGVRYVGDMQADDANTEEVPDYTLVDMALAYNFARQGLPGVTAQLNVNNLLDKEYVASCYNASSCPTDPSAPDMSYLSCFPNESEHLFAPLTYLRPSGNVQEVAIGDSLVTIVEVIPSFGA